MIIKEANRLMNVQEYYFSKKLKEIKELNEKGASIINIGLEVLIWVPMNR